MECGVDRYCIKIESCNKRTVEDKLQNVNFLIEETKKGSMLCRLSSKNAKSVDVVIPREFPTGQRIDFLESNFVQGKFGKITISNGIKVNECAFAYSNIDEVVWPDDCTCIPCSCFYKSKISKISNIDNVHKIFNEAFSHSKLKEITWPTLCTNIPAMCFFDSPLEKIDNLDNVERIDKGAFFWTKLGSLNLSDTNISRLENCSLSGMPKGCSITPPYYVSPEKFEKAIRVET